jgi:hypothetical protein
MPFANQEPTVVDGLLRNYSGELMILVLFVLVVTTLMVLVPQLLRAQMRKAELLHAEHMKALEQGILIPTADEPSRAAGRTAMLVPMVVVISAGAVTCFLVAYRSEQVFSVALAVWSVAGLVSLAAITGGVALLGRLAQLHHGLDDLDDQAPEDPVKNP